MRRSRQRTVCPASSGRTHGVDLERDETLGGLLVDQVGGGDAVDPGLEHRAARLHPQPVPLAGTEGGAGAGIEGHREQPTASRLVVDARAPCALAGVDLDLVAVNATVHHLGTALAAHLDPRVERALDQEVELEHEVGEGLLGGQEAVGAVRHRDPDDRAVLDPVLGRPIDLAPPREIAPVEQCGPAVAALGRRGAAAAAGGVQQNQREGAHARSSTARDHVPRSTATHDSGPPSTVPAEGNPLAGGQRSRAPRGEAW
jgi:hypothetical protein